MSMSTADSTQGEQRVSQAVSQPVTAFPVLATRPQTPDEKKEDARWTIARRLVSAYVFLLAFSIVIPMVLLWVPHANGISLSDARDLMVALSGTLSGLVGILGFVMGYYFKELDAPSKTGLSSGKTKKS